MGGVLDVYFPAVLFVFFCTKSKEKKRDRKASLQKESGVVMVAKKRKKKKQTFCRMLFFWWRRRGSGHCWFLGSCESESSQITLICRSYCVCGFFFLSQVAVVVEQVREVYESWQRQKLLVITTNNYMRKNDFSMVT
jgi:hypothetical protein